MIDATFLRRVKPVFIGFCVRDLGLSQSDAAWEFDYILTSNGRAMLRDYYLYCPRIGAPFALNRARRMEIYEVFCNAQNHVYFAEELNNV